MKAGMTGAAVFCLMWLLPLAANAQNIRPECAKMRDKIGCTCALNNGGGINPIKGNWFSVRGRHPNRGGATNSAFTACVARGGRA
jgi:putative hemolysin